MARYATNTHLDNYFQNFSEKYYGTYWDDDPTLGTVLNTNQTSLNSDLDRESVYIDSKLSALGYRTPLNTLGASGTYDQMISEWCSMGVIYKRLVRSHADDYADGFPPDIEYFKDRAESLEKDIISGGLSLDVDTTIEESGIGYGYAGGTAATSAAVFYNNKEYGGIYTHESWEGRYVISIDSVSGGNSIGIPTFKWSRDGGNSYEDTTIDTSTTWVSLGDGIKIRWAPSGTGSMQLHLNDWWYFDVVPQAKLNTKTYKDRVGVVEFARG